MFEARITKYDPRLRDADGRYTAEDWTMFSQVGKEYSGSVLTPDSYAAVENAHVASALAFLLESDIHSLTVLGLENPNGYAQAPTEGESLGHGQIAATLRGLLRDEYWCRLETANASIHIGYDYYMYIAVPGDCPAATATTTALGLFVEPMESPYEPSDADL